MHIGIVGGGIAGLVAANLLAEHGFTITLFEAADALGGRGRSDTFAGAIVNLGPHAVFRDGFALRLFRRLGIEVGDSSPNLAKFRLVLDDDLVPAPVSPWACLTASYLGFSERAELLRLMSRAMTIGDSSPWDDVPFGDVIARARSPRVRRILEMSMSISSYSRSSCISAGAVFRQIRRAMSNVIYPDAGWGRIVEQLAARATTLGVEIRLREPAKSLERAAVTTRTGTIAFDAVVLAIPPARVETLTGADLGPRRKTDMATLDLVLGNTLDLQNTFDTQTGVYLSVHSDVADLGDNVVVHVAKYLDPYREGRRDQNARKDRTDVEALLERLAPQWRHHMLFERYMPALPVNHWFPDAAVGGEKGRPGVRLDERHWIAGDWVGDEGLLLDAAVASAAECSRQIAEAFETKAMAS